jgi:hypothetical protein
VSTIKSSAHARMPGDCTRDTVAIHAGTARLISDTIDRIFGVADVLSVEPVEPEEATT